MAGVATALELWQLFAAVVVFGAALPVVIVAFNTLLQRRTPSRLMGRVSASVEVLTTTPQALSIAVGALLVTLVDYRLMFAAMTAGTLLAAAYLGVALRGRVDRVTPAAHGSPQRAFLARRAAARAATRALRSSTSSRSASSGVGALPPYDAGSHHDPGGCSSAG